VIRDCVPACMPCAPSCASFAPLSKDVTRLTPSLFAASHAPLASPAHKNPKIPPARPPARQIPLDPAVRLRSDEGVPVVVADPSSRSAQAYVGIARRVAAKLAEADARSGNDGGGGDGPKITMG
jgi:hypothetical protein